METFTFFFVLVLVSSNIASSNGKGAGGGKPFNIMDKGPGKAGKHGPRRFSVLDHGALGDGKTDDSKAFLNAWTAACNEPAKSKVVVPPERIYLLNPVMFNGPCKPKKIEFVIMGTIIPPNSPKSWDGLDASQWVGFKGVTGLTVRGPGLINGLGKSWWDQSCRYHPDLKGCTKLAPTSLKFVSCNDSSLRNIAIIDSPQTHVLLHGSGGIKIDNVEINSPGDSPNTDGIHIQSSKNLLIAKSKISSGDDCVSIGDYTSDVFVDNITCGPGHGISIGSLGKDGNVVQVENINVKKSVLKDTTNGARIKTWQVGKGYVRKVTFEDLRFENVENPVIVDQNYCEVRGACKELSTGVKISDVNFKGITGTSSTEIAVNLNCSRSVPCSGIEMDNIQLTSAKPGMNVKSSCANAYGKEGRVAPGPCLQQGQNGFKA